MKRIESILIVFRVNSSKPIVPPSLRDMVLMKVILVLIVSLFKPSLSYRSRSDTLSNLVKDIIENERVAPVLWARTCWSRYDELNFMKSISVPVQMVKSASINLPIDETTNKQWFFIDMNCEQNPNILTEIDEKYFAHPYLWIIADATHNSIQNLTLLPGSNIILANQEPHSKKFNLKQVYQIGRGGSLIYEEFGYWSQEGRLVDLRSTRIRSRRRRDLKGHRLVAAAVFVDKNSDDHTDLDDYHYNKIDPYSKISLLITKHWIHSVNATMHLDIHRTWGYRDPKTGLYSGMSGQLQRKEADVGGSIIFLTADRISFLEYLSMEIPAVLTFILRPPQLSYVKNIYYLPFTGTVWICAIILVVLCTIMVALTFYFQSDRENQHMEASDYFLFAIASSCQMGSNILTKILSARISMLFLFIALLFIYTSFTANIVALLQSTSKSFRTIADLQNPLIEVGVFDTPYNRHYFKIETEPSRKRLYDTKIAPPNGPDAFVNLTYGISRMRQGMYAFNVDTLTGYNEIERTFFEHEKCGLVEIRFMIYTDTWCVIQKHSPYKEILKISMLKIREHGIQTREALRIVTKRPRCYSEAKSVASIRLVDCYSALLILVYGAFASFLIFCIEIIVHSKLVLAKEK